MDLYNVVLFGHVLGAIVLVSFGFVMPLMVRRTLKTPTVGGLREWSDAIHKYGKLGPPAAILVLLSGIYMTLTEFSFQQAWVAVSLVLFLLSGAIAGGILDKHWAKVVEAAEAAPDGPVPADLRAMVAEPKAMNFESILLGLDLSIVFMMTNKPGLVGALIATAVGQVIAGALIMRAARARQGSPATA